jgi:hypothetical protein
MRNYQHRRGRALYFYIARNEHNSHANHNRYPEEFLHHCHTCVADSLFDTEEGIAFLELPVPPTTLNPMTTYTAYKDNHV